MSVLERLRQAAPAAFDDEPVAFAYLFGSHAVGQARPDSDIDVAVHLAGAGDEPIEAGLRLARRLATTSGLGGIEAAVILDEAPLPLAGRIRQQRQVFFSRDEPGRVAYESYIARRYHDFRIHEAPRDRERLQAIAEGRR